MEPNQDNDKNNALGHDPFADFDDMSWAEDASAVEEPPIETEADESVVDEPAADVVDADDLPYAPENLPTAVFPDIPLPEVDDVDEDDPFALLDAEIMAMDMADDDEDDDPLTLLDAEMMADVETAVDAVADEAEMSSIFPDEEADDLFALLDAEMLGMAEDDIDDLPLASDPSTENIHVYPESEEDDVDEMPDVDALLAAIDSEIEDIHDAIHPEEGDMEDEVVADSASGDSYVNDLIASLDDEIDALLEDTDDEPIADTYLDDLIAGIDGEIDALHEVGLLADDVGGEETAVSTTDEQHIIFNLAGVEYTVPINNVTEIGRPLDITAVPNTPIWTRGVANLRGDIISIIDLRLFLGMPENEYSEDGRLLVTQSQVEDIIIGMLVDRVSGIGNLQPHKITAPTAPIEDQVAPYLRGVYEYDGRLLVVLNLDKLLLSSEMQRFESI